MASAHPSCLILGGARSGKSAYAQSLAETARPEQLFIATAEALDAEMRERIDRHIADRGESWSTHEAPLELSDVIVANSQSDKAIVVDCLTLWLSNLMHAGRSIRAETRKLGESIYQCEAPLFLVSNEVGMGIVPESELGRRFRDEQGVLNKAIAEICDQVLFIAAGLPLRLKPQSVDPGR